MSPPLLISDLGRPERFLNMLRVFKVQSPMSVGAWTLVAFSSAAGAAAFADLAHRSTGGKMPVTIVADAAEILSAATGLVLATYTGVLLGATAIPVWSRNARVLPMLFGASGMGAAVSTLELLGHRTRALNRIGIGAALVGKRSRALSRELATIETLTPLRDGANGQLARAPRACSRVPCRSSCACSPAARLLRGASPRCSTIAGLAAYAVAWLQAGKT